MRCCLRDSLLGQPVREGRFATEQEAGKLRAVRAKEPLARSFARKDKPPPVGRPVGCAPGDRLSGTGNMSRFASVQRRRATSLLATFVIDAQEKPSAVRGDVRLELEDAF
jgi:hypothetical protein